MTSCACIYTGAEDYKPSVSSSVTRTAKKDPMCDECGALIKHGQTYEVVKGCWDGTWDTFKTCAPCLAIRKEFFCDGWIYSQMREHFEDSYGFDYARVEDSK